MEDTAPDASPASQIDAYRQQVEAATAYVQEHLPTTPALGLILGTGLGRLADEIDVDTALSYDDIPHFPVATVESHDGRLLLGSLRGVPVVAMQGRFHLYEGYTPRAVTLPVRVMGQLGVEALFVSNAAGGMNPHFQAGDVMLVTDHLNLQGSNPLVGPNVDEWGPRFPDMSAPYDPDLCERAEQAALDRGIKLQRGVYASVLGPNLETRAEYRMLRRLGADAVGMSTVPEVIVARHMGLRVLALSAITDECFPDALEPVTMEAIFAAADEAEPKLTQIMRAVAETLPTGTPA